MKDNCTFICLVILLKSLEVHFFIFLVQVYFELKTASTAVDITSMAALKLFEALHCIHRGVLSAALIVFNARPSKPASNEAVAIKKIRSVCIKSC